MFGRFKSKGDAAPRWGFSVGWDDYVAAVRAQLERRGVAFDDGAWQRGRIPLPESADYEEWDLRAVTERCRGAQPHEWKLLLAESLADAFGSPAPDDPAKLPVRDARARFDPPLERGHLRLQLFNGELARTFSHEIAKRPLGDVAMVLVADMGLAEITLDWTDVEALGLGHDEAFRIASENSVRVMAGTVQAMKFSLPGGTGEIMVSNAFFLGAAMVELRERLPAGTLPQAGTPQIFAPISWHHWIRFELEPSGVPRDTIGKLRDFTAQTAEGITTITNVSAWVTRSLWWWPAGTSEPVVIDDASLPKDLASCLA